LVEVLGERIIFIGKLGKGGGASMGGSGEQGERDGGRVEAGEVRGRGEMEAEDGYVSPEDVSPPFIIDNC
jgi:hypothetical protein